MIKFICIFNNLLYLSFQLKKYLWNYFSTGFWSIFPYQVKVLRQKAYLKGKPFVCVHSKFMSVEAPKSVICAFKARNPRLIPQATTIYFVFLVWKNIFDRRRFIDTKRFLPNYLLSHEKVQLALCFRFSHSPFWRVGEGVNLALTFVPQKKLKKKGTNLNHASSNQFHVTKI